MQANSKILVIDTEESFHQTIRLCLENEKTDIITAFDGDEGLTLFQRNKPDLVITDLMVPKRNGLEILSKIKCLDKTIPVIILTADNNINSTIEAMKLGAFDYIFKPLKINEFRPIIRKALSSQAEVKKRVINILDAESEASSDGDLFGKTAVMRELIKQIGPISLYRTSVLIEGENGAGKEILARKIHSAGVTKNQPFIGVNCTALSSSLLESELFGHEKGSFTGAYRTKKGKLELAGKGTLFLDEVSEMPLDMQAKLLRVLQEKEFERVGGEESIPFSARVIAATNNNLKNLVSEHKFRLDLFHRLNVIHLRVPPLRERKEDIPILAITLLRKINKELDKNVSKIPYDKMELLKGYEWSGNVRELENTLRRAVVLSNGDTIDCEIPFLEGDDHKNSAILSLMSLADVERRHIEFILNHVLWNKNKACQILKITKPTLLKKIKDYKLFHGSNV